MFRQLLDTAIHEWQATLLDIALVTFLIYELIKIARGTRAVPSMRGVAVFLGAWLFSQTFGLHTFNLFVSPVISRWGVLALLILYAPEIRLALEQLGGRSRLASRGLGSVPAASVPQLVNELATAVEELSMRKIGALIVVERETSLNDILETGCPIRGQLSAELLNTIFYPNTPLHDGAVVVSGPVIAAAACILPLSQRPDLSSSLGTRHRAALGLAEQTDAVVLVVSEERGAVSLACERNFFEDLGAEELKARLLTLLRPEGRPMTFWNRRRNSETHDEADSA